MAFKAAELEQTFATALGELSNALDAEGIEWMLIGGLAVGAWTTPRGTKDVDLALSVPNVEQLAKALRVAHLGVPTSLSATVRESGVVRVTRALPGQPLLVVDLLCAGTDFEVEALSRRRSSELFGVRIWIASPDDLLLYKLIAGRPRDMADADRLVRLDDVPEDLPRVRAWARIWEVEDRLDRVLREASE